LSGVTASRGGEANPIIAMRRSAASVAQRLIGGAVVHDEVALIVHGLGLIGLRDRQRAGSTFFAALASRGVDYLNENAFLATYRLELSPWPLLTNFNV
jgi:hypothetical protein